MDLGYLEYYLIVVNLTGFLFFSLNHRLRAHKAGRRGESVSMITALLGGSLGILAAILLFDRKAEKDNMMQRVFVLCVFVIQTVAVLFIKGFHRDDINFAFWKLFYENKILSVYLVSVNLITLLAFGIDKFLAVRRRRRIRIVTLLGLSFLGGSIGGLVGMYAFRHKTKKDYFAFGIPLILMMQMALIFYVINL